MDSHYCVCTASCSHWSHMAKPHALYTVLTLRWLMSYTYMEHPFLMLLDHTQRRSTVGRTPLDEWSARRRDLYLTTQDTHNRQISMPAVGFEPKISAGERPCRSPAEIFWLLLSQPFVRDQRSMSVWVRLSKPFFMGPNKYVSLISFIPKKIFCWGAGVGVGG